MRYNTLLFISTMLFLTQAALSQSVGIGKWREHLPYHQVTHVAETGDLIYAATPYSIFSYDKEDASITRLNKINGLSDIGVSTIISNPSQSTLIIAYNNTNIDLIQDGKIINISDIKRKPILGNKIINNISFIGDLAYLACGFGIVVMNVERHEIVDTYFIGPDGSNINVLDVAFHEPSRYIYAATESGIYKADIDTSNLANFEYWAVDETMGDKAYNHIEQFKDMLIVNKPGTNDTSDTLFAYNGSSWDYFNVSETSRVKSIKANSDHLLVSHLYFVYQYNQSLQEVTKVWTYNPGSPNPEDALISKEGLIYVGDRNNGLVKRTDEWTYEFIRPSGPATTDVFAMQAHQNYLWVVPGGKTSSWGSMWKGGLVYGLDDGNWRAFNRWNTQGMDHLLDLLCIAVDPNDPTRFFTGSWGAGLIEMKDGVVTGTYDDQNSSLEYSVYNPSWMGIGGVAFDAQGNLWVTNSSAANLLSVKKTDGTWRSFSLSPVASAIDLGGITIDKSGQKWMLVRDHGLIVFSDMGTIDNTADDKVRRLSGATGNGSLPGATIMSLAVDQNGELWIGTNEGVAVIRNPENVFTGGNFDAYRPIIDQDGYGAYLLDSEAVTAIAIDGANRKWFGTDRAGVFLMSADGLEKIYHFTEDNSPLLSNSITSLTIDGNGEVFFGTSRGIIGYRAEATPPPPVFTDVVVFPNPVRPEYEGIIAVRGLVKDADIKIMDIAGNLIFKTRAFGGQAIWNGRNFDGRKAQSGVYLVFISNNDGSETLATKILFMN
ncbi:MAG: T9SS type A sorting domain-containing protein [Bacteroidales bacterium]|nr:T9SS type A sorting domain-containing protein [Bacteroidales bacterium]